MRRRAEIEIKVNILPRILFPRTLSGVTKRVSQKIIQLFELQEREVDNAKVLLSGKLYHSAVLADWLIDGWLYRIHFAWQLQEKQINERSRDEAQWKPSQPLIQLGQSSPTKHLPCELTFHRTKSMMTPIKALFIRRYNLLNLRHSDQLFNRFSMLIQLRSPIVIKIKNFSNVQIHKQKKKEKGKIEEKVLVSKDKLICRKKKQERGMNLEIFNEPIITRGTCFRVQGSAGWDGPPGSNRIARSRTLNIPAT